MAAEPRFYFRVDGGYAFHDDPVMREAGIYDLTETRIDDTWTVGGGVGMYFGRNVRADITVDHRFNADASGNLADHAATLEGVRRFGLSTTVAMANIYYDFDMGSRFTPYVGAGIGLAFHRTKAGTVEPQCGCTGIIEGETSSHVAGALMAGFALTLRERLVLDGGYRFLYLGETATGAVRFTGTAPGDPAVSEDPTVESIHGHEFRLGLRYNVH